MRTAAADEDLTTRILRLLDVAGNFVERSLATVWHGSGCDRVLCLGYAHDRADEVREVRRRANLELRDLVQELLLEPGAPHRRGDIESRERRALLAYELAVSVG